MTLREGWKLVSLGCEEASRLASAAQDRPLVWHERWALRLHGFTCRNCRLLVRQLETLRAVLTRLPDSLRKSEALPRLSAERKLRIKQLLRDAQQA